MFKIKKSAFILLLAAAAVLGGLGTYGWLFVNSKVADGSSIMVPLDVYDYYTYLEATYDKAELLRSVLMDEYYIPVDEAQINEGIYRGIMDSVGDYYTFYMDAEEYDEMQVSLTGNYSGVGITMQADYDGFIKVSALNKNGPAYDSGIKVGDIIYMVDGEVFTSETMSQCAAKIRGPEGTSVTVTVVSGDGQSDYTFKRTRIFTETVSSKTLDGGIGYIKIDSFEEATAEDFSMALTEIENSGAKAFVIDLRDNPGGLVNMAVDIADMLMDAGTVVYAENQAGQRYYYRTTPGRTDLKYAILVNGNSASSSEILSVGVQENGEGIIVGTQSFGKGIIQSVEELEDGSAFQMTIMQYYSPNGNVIHKQGVMPDYEVELDEDCWNEDGELVNDKQLQKAVELLSE